MMICPSANYIGLRAKVAPYERGGDYRIGMLEDVVKGKLYEL